MASRRTRAITRDEATKHIPVIVVTSKNQETDRVWGMRQGAKDYLMKPIDAQGSAREGRGDQIGPGRGKTDSACASSSRDSPRDCGRLRPKAEPTSRLGVQAGRANWLLKLDDAGEMLPLPEFSAVPLTKSWYLGLANIRGVLASVVDFAAFMGGEQTVRTPDCRLLLIAERFNSFSGLLIGPQCSGLKNVAAMQAAEKAAEKILDRSGLPRRGWPPVARSWT